MWELAHGSPQLQTLNFNSLLIPNKLILAEKIPSSICLSCQQKHCKQSRHLGFLKKILKTFHLKPADTFLYLDTNSKQVWMQTPLPLKLRHNSAYTPGKGSLNISLSSAFSSAIICFIFQFPYFTASQVALVVKNSPAKAGDIGDMGLISGLGGSQESLAANSTILAWRSRWTEEPSGLESKALPRVGHDCNDLAYISCFTL